jgi:hypothetical protein
MKTKESGNIYQAKNGGIYLYIHPECRFRINETTKIGHRDGYLFMMSQDWIEKHLTLSELDDFSQEDYNKFYGEAGNEGISG